MPGAIVLLLVADVALAAMHLWDPAVPNWAARGESTDYAWNLDREANLPTWFASLQLALIGTLLLALAFARHQASRREAWTLGLGGALFVSLSLDEQVLLHEKLGRGLEQVVGHRDTTAFEATGPWALVAAPIFVGAALAGTFMLRDLLTRSHRAQLLVGGGLALFVVSFAGMELAANAVSITRERYTVLLEETGELIAATLILWGVYELVRACDLRLMGRAPGQPSPCSSAPLTEASSAFSR